MVKNKPSIMSLREASDTSTVDPSASASSSGPSIDRPLVVRMTERDFFATGAQQRMDLGTYRPMPNDFYPDYMEGHADDARNNISSLSARPALASTEVRMSYPIATSPSPYMLPSSDLGWHVPAPSNQPSFTASNRTQQIRALERDWPSRQRQMRTLEHVDTKAYEEMVETGHVSRARENVNDKTLDEKLEMCKTKIGDLEVQEIAPQSPGYEPNNQRPPPFSGPEKSLFEKFNESMRHEQLKPKRSLITNAFIKEENALKSPGAYTQPFCEFLTENPTVFHAVDYFEKKLERAGFKKLSERKTWNGEVMAGGKYFVARNGSSLIAFSVGDAYKSGNGVAMIAGHVDALTAKLKPMSAKKNSAGYLQLGVAPYAGALNTTWWDRDLGIAGKVLVKDPITGKITTKLVKLGWPIARIPTLAPHFGIGMLGQNNAETQAVPIIGLDNSDIGAVSEEFKNLTLGGAGSFAATQPPKLVRAIAGELLIQDYSSIVNWELELFDTQPAQTGGLDKEFIFAGRIDDKLCSWSAIEGLLASVSTPTKDDGIVKLVGLFDDEEIGSLLRQGARGNFLPSTVERISECFSKIGASANVLSQTYANSFLVSADVTHAVNPNFLGSYLEGHAPRLNTGLVISGDSNGHLTTDSISAALMTQVAEKSDSKLQLFQIRNDSRSGGTVGPMLSSAMGVRAVDAGIPQLSMHSIRATTGSLDPGLGVKIFKGFFDYFEEVDKEFE